MVFAILNRDTGKTYRSDDAKFIEQLQEEVGFHPSYRCEIYMDEDGSFALENGCSDIKFLDKKYVLVNFYTDEKKDTKKRNFEEFWEHEDYRVYVMQQFTLYYAGMHTAGKTAEILNVSIQDVWKLGKKIDKLF